MMILQISFEIASVFHLSFCNNVFWYGPGASRTCPIATYHLKDVNNLNTFFWH